MGRVRSLLLLAALLSATPALSARDTMSLVFSRDGKQVFSAHVDGSVVVHDSAGKKVADWQANARGAFGLALSPDGKVLATAGEDRAVRLWDVATRKELLALTGHQQRAVCVAFSPDGKRLAS